MTRNIILSMSSKCNLKCDGCYIDDSDNYDIIKILKSINLLMNDYTIHSLILHGGEPTLNNIRDIEDICKYVRRKNKQIRISIQTNCTNITDEWIELFKKYNISVGISYRGYGDIFKQLSGVDKYNEFIKSLNKLKENDLLNGAIFYFPSKYGQIIRENLYDIIDDINELGIKRISFHESIEENGNDYLYEIVSNAQKYIFKQKYHIQIRSLYMLYGLVTGMSNRKDCSWKHDCYNYITINGQGRMVWCNRKINEFNSVYDECLICPIFGVCEGGCEKIREINNGKFPYCEYRIAIYKFVVEHINDFHLHYGFLR